MEGKYSWVNTIKQENPVACRLPACNSLLRQDWVIENMKYFIHGCGFLLVVDWLMAAVLTLGVGQIDRGLKRNTATFFRISLRWSLKLPPKRWYACTKLHGFTGRKFMIWIFTTVLTLKCRVVSPCFSFPMKLTQSVYTQHGHKQTSTECCCILRTVTAIQQTDTHQCYTLCVSVTALLQLDSLISVSSSSNTYSCVPHWNISPYIFVLASSNAISETYE